ncbi:hypothetical protein FOA52_011566 [Chlamydomonas sp. UWO 241]|nr:hypothetical protein FOA52_011566 [Chlamydomonas sp. UWO 241]
MIKEEAFTGTVDAVEEYLGLQRQLKAALQKGLFSLAQAKYSMGALGQQHYLGADMRATSTVAVVDDKGSDSMYSGFELRGAGGAPSTSCGSANGHSSSGSGGAATGASGGGAANSRLPANV